jgi:hypothetical protein
MKPAALFQARQSLANVLRTEDVPGSIIFLSCCDCLDDTGEEGSWLQFEPKTIQLEIRDKLHILISPEEFDRLLAALTIFNTNLAFVSLPSFRSLITGLDSNTVTIDTPVGEVISPSVLCSGLMEMVLLYPPSETETFDKEIIGFIKETLRAGGLVSYPKIVEMILGNPVYNDVLTSDPEAMAMQTDRVEEVQDSLDDWIDNWCRVINKIQFTTGNKETAVKLMQSFKTKKDFTLHG